MWYYGQTKDIVTGHKIAPAYDIKWRKPDEDFEGEFCDQLMFKKLAFSKTIEKIFIYQIFDVWI